MDKTTDANITKTQNRIKSETKDKFDALLKQALNSKGRKNVQNIAAKKSVSDIDSLTSSNENLDKPNLSSEVVKVDVHENARHDNYILNKFLNESRIADSNDEIISIDVNDPDVMFIKPPVPRPRKTKLAPLAPSSASTSSVGTYKVTSPKTPRNLRNEKPTNVINSEIVAEIPIVHKSPCNSKTVAEIPSHSSDSQLSSVHEAKITNTPLSSIIDECSEKSAPEVIKTDEIQYENEVKPKLKQKKHAKKLPLESRSTFKDVVETLIEDRKKPNYTYEKIVGITIHKTDRLKLDSLVIHPVVKVHIVNAETGAYLNKSDKNRPVVFFYENKDILYISPVISEPYNLYEKRSFFPAWEETLIINEDINFMLQTENNCVLFFEIIDFVSFSTANSQFHQKGSSKGWHKIAWAFLKPVGKNHELNTDKKVRLQLYYPSKHKKVPPHVCTIFHWWHGKKLQKYPASLYVSVKGIIPPEKVMETLRSKTPIQGEKASRINLDSEPLEYHNLINAAVEGTGSKIESKKDAPLPKLKYKSFKFPNKCIAELPSYEEGCLVLKFSHSGLYLACAVLIDDMYSIIIFSVKSYEEVCKYSGHQGLIYNISWSKDDQIIVTASADCTVCVWNFTRRIFIEMLPHPSYVYATEISSANLIATGCYDNIVRLWICKTNTTHDLIQELEGHNGYITSVCFNKKCTYLYSSDSLGTIIEWKSDTEDNWKLKREIKLIDLRATIINQILLHARERKLLIHARDSTLRIIDLKTGYVLHWLQGAINNRFNTMCCFSACDSYVFAGGENSFVNVWKVDTGETVATYSPYDAFHYQNLTIHGVQFHPHDNILAIAHYGHGLPILLATYDSALHGKSNIGLKIFHNDDETNTQKGKQPKSENLKQAATKVIENDSQKKKRKIKFEDVIEKIDQIIVSQSSVTSSKSSVDLLN